MLVSTNSTRVTGPSSCTRLSTFLMRWKKLLNYIPHLDYPSQLPCASTVCYHGNLRAVSARTRSSRTWESKTSSTQVHCKWHSSRCLHGVPALHVTHGQRCAAFEHVLRLFFLLLHKTPIKTCSKSFFFSSTHFLQKFWSRSKHPLVSFVISRSLTIDLIVAALTVQVHIIPGLNSGILTLDI